MKHVSLLLLATVSLFAPGASAQTATLVTFPGPTGDNTLEKWGLQLASRGIVALAVDSFTRRRLSGVRLGPGLRHPERQHLAAAP